MAKRIINQAMNNMMYMSGRVENNDFIYVDVQILNLRDRFSNDEEFVKHLAELLNINLIIKEDK